MGDGVTQRDQGVTWALGGAMRGENWGDTFGGFTV